jgi:uncharacterized protein involved in type VI secretion and phage assembly
VTDYGAFQALFSAPRPESSRIYGVVVGIVTNNQDPDKQGRVKVKFPWLSDSDESNWARIAAPMAGKEMGVYFLPEVDDEVLVVFEHGRADRPFVIGALWNGKEAPPADNSDGNNDIRVIKSRSGHTITLDDTDGGEKITIADGKQKSSIVLDAAEGSLTITSEGDLTVKAKGKITLESDADVSIKGQSVSIKDGKLKVQ